MPKLPKVIAICSCLLPGLVAADHGRADGVLFDPFTGYRMDRYRAPIPGPPEGIAAVTTDAVRAALRDGATALDVHPLRTFALAGDGTWIYPQTHVSLPGALWLPVVGWGVIEGWAEEYLRSVLDRDASREKPVIVFCQLDCWLSWNAVQRVEALGYRALWYPGGVDEWQAEGYALHPVEPVSLPD